MATIHGTCPDSFEPVSEAWAKNLDAGEDIGSSAAVVIEGELVVDIWGGFIDPERTRPWQRDTIVNNFSTTKTMTALCMLVLADRGELDLDAPVAKYWPEFAQNGKSGVLVKHLLSHASGVPGWDQRLTVEQLRDVPYATKLLEKQAPWWRPGTASGYHSISYGHLNGEVIRRITGQSLGTFLQNEVAGPLGADYHIGTGAALDHRVSVMIQGATRPADGAGSIAERVFFNPFITADISGTTTWRRSELGGSNGHGNAKAVAAIQSVLSNGGEARGVRLLSRAGAERALELQTDGVDLVMGAPLRWGLGYAVSHPVVEQLRSSLKGRRIAFWGGSGGSIAFNDFDARMTIAYVMNRHV